MWRKLCLLFRVCALTPYKEGQLWTVSWCNSLIPRCLAVPYGLIQEVQLMSQALVVVILDIPSKGCCILVCAMAANSSMSVTHRLIPGALSVLSLSQACMYTLRPTLLILLFLPSLSLSPPPPLLPAIPVYLPCSAFALPSLSSLLSSPPSLLSKAVESIITSNHPLCRWANAVQTTHAQRHRNGNKVYTEEKERSLISTHWLQTLN